MSRMDRGLPGSTNETRADHLEISIPSGARNIAAMPSIMILARRGILENRPSMSSMSLLPIWCSAVPTQRNSMDLVTAWNIISRTPAQTASGVPTPAHATISPRLAMVEYASTRLPLLWEMAAMDASRNVTPPTVMTM